MTCPAYAKADPTLQSPVYAIDPLYQAVVGQGLVSLFSDAGQIWAFGNPSGANTGNSNNNNTGVANNPNGTTPLRIAALTSLTDQRGNPADLSHMIVMRDFIGGQGNANQPVHKSYVNALFFDWHVGTLVPTTLMPQ
jgi:prepilin-type processing-associated H-X9-DG protein